MCIPVAALPIIAAGVQAAGTLMGGLSANSQAKYEAALSNRNAAMEVEAAHESVLAGQDERRDFWRRIAQAKGQQIASMAANGIDVGEGTAARIQDDTQMLANADAANLYKNIENRTRGSLINAANFQAEAKAQKQRGRAALISSVFSAGSSLLSGFQQSKALGAKASPGSTLGGSSAYTYHGTTAGYGTAH